MKKNKIVVVILRGVPGSGKSTLAKKLEEFYNFTRLSSDELGAWKGPLQKAIKRGDQYIVLDRCHSSLRQRMNTIKTLVSYKDNIQTILTTLPEISFPELKKRIQLDKEHTLETRIRLLALKAHSKDRKGDVIDMHFEGWDHSVSLKSNEPDELVEWINLNN